MKHDLENTFSVIKIHHICYDGKGEDGTHGSQTNTPDINTVHESERNSN